MGGSTLSNLFPFNLDGRYYALGNYQCLTQKAFPKQSVKSFIYLIQMLDVHNMPDTRLSPGGYFCE